MKKITLNEEINRIGKLMNLTEASLAGNPIEKEVIEQILKFFGVSMRESITLASGRIIEADTIKTIFKNIEERGTYFLRAEEKEVMKELTAEAIAKNPGIIRAMGASFENSLKTMGNAYSKEVYVGTYLNRMEKVLGKNEMEILRSEIKPYLEPHTNPGHSSGYKAPEDVHFSPKNDAPLTPKNSEVWATSESQVRNQAEHLGDKLSQNEILEKLRRTPVSGVKFQLWESQVDAFCAQKGITDHNWIYMIKIGGDVYGGNTALMIQSLTRAAKEAGVTNMSKIRKWFGFLTKPETGQDMVNFGNNVKSAGKSSIAITIGTVTILTALLLYKFGHLTATTVDAKVSKITGQEPGLNPLPSVDSLFSKPAVDTTKKPQQTQNVDSVDWGKYKPQGN
jgi:hypothetical protein